MTRGASTRRVRALAAGCAAALALTGCATGALSDAPSAPTTGPTLPASISGSAPPTATRATLTVTVPDLPGPSTAAPAESAPPSQAPPESVAPSAAPASTAEQVGDPAPEPAPGGAGTTPDPATPEQPTEPVPPPAPAPAPPAGDALSVSLANCDGCSVIGSRLGVSGDLSAALVSTSAGRALLLSVQPDGAVRGVINVPYGSSFPAPAGGVLACDASAHCAVEAKLGDGRAIVSTFELTGSGAWRDISGDDAFPSATDRSAVVDLGGEIGVAVQDRADAAPVWMLYRWSGERFTVVGCAPDGPAPGSPDAVAPEACLS